MKKDEIEFRAETNEEWADQVDNLADQVKMLALNLAISLARTKKESDELKELEPQFTQLINGSVEVIKEVTAALRAFRNEHLIEPPRGDEEHQLTRIEKSLNEIQVLSKRVLESINGIKKQKGQVDKYS